MGSLREFAVLKSVTIDSWLLVRGAARWEEELEAESLLLDDDSNHHHSNSKLVDLLPASCEEVVLRNCQFRRAAKREEHELGYRRVRAQLEGLEDEEKGEKLPVLRMVTIKTNSDPRLFAPWLEDVKKKCEGVGVEIRVQYL